MASSRRNLLFLCQLLPFPLDAGPKVRAFYTLRYLAERHHVTLAAFVRPSDGPEAINTLRQLGVRVVAVPLRRSRLRDLAAFARSLASGQPFLIARDEVPAMRQALRALVAEARWDYIHADQLWMAPYALAARAAARAAGCQPRLVLDQHNAVFLIPGRMAAASRNPLARAVLQREARQMARYELQACLEFDRVVTVTQEDQAALAGLAADGQHPNLAGTIPICIDPGAVPAVPQLSSEPNVLFLGGMHWPPNADGAEWFARDVLPRVQAQVPAAHFLAIGKSPPPALATAGITAPGYVDDPSPYWQRSRVFVVPLRSGGGMRVKILDAWAHGVPVVSTTIGAEGLVWTHGENILIADTPAAFAEAVICVLTDSALAQRIAAGGRALVEQHYDWRRAYRAWDELYPAPSAGQAPA